MSFDSFRNPSQRYSGSSLNSANAGSLSQEAESFASDINRIAALAANLLEAHSVVVFLPASSCGQLVEDTDRNLLIPVGVHTLSPTSILAKGLSLESGLIGWVAKNKKSIHVSPFERDSRVLGFYKEDLMLKSLIGVPIALKDRNDICGVMLADSKKSFAFSKLQGKLLEDLAVQVSRTIALHNNSQKQPDIKTSWNQFISSADKFADSNGRNEIAAVRIRATNISEFESRFGLIQTCSFLQQVYRLISQSLPPHCPTFVTPLGEYVMLIDSMTTDLYTNKILALTEYTKLHGMNLQIEFRARAFPRGERTLSLEHLINLTAFEHQKQNLLETSQAAPNIEEAPRRKILGFR